LIMKADVEYKIGSRMRMVFSGATEAHIIAKEISRCIRFVSMRLLTQRNR
jgi:hypothetical protein